MAVVTKSIGTTARDYSTITAWEAASYGATASDSAIGECYDDSAFDESADLVDATPTSILLTVHSAERHDGTAGTGARIERTASYSHLVRISNSVGTTIEWLEGDGNGNQAQAGLVFGNNSSGPDVLDRTKQVIRNVIVHPESTSSRFPVGIDAKTRPLTVLNSIVYNVVSTGVSGSTVSFGVGGDNNMDVYNCTIHNVKYDNSSGSVFGIGDTINSAVAVAKNNLVTDVSSSGASTVEDYEGSLSNAATATNGSEDLTGDTTGMTSANLFVSTVGGSEDLHLKTGADAIDAGTDLGTTPSGVQFDIDGDDRDTLAVTWDMGADEFIAAPGGANPKGVFGLPLDGPFRRAVI